MHDHDFDFARRAAEAFMAANRCEDPGEATRLRQEAYALVERIDQGKHKRATIEAADGIRQVAWRDVMPRRPGGDD